LTNLGDGNYALIVAGAGHAGLAQAAGNLANVRVVGPEGLNVYDVVRAEVILILERELPRVKEVWA
jgi:large subunit ribosomal protein L4